MAGIWPVRRLPERLRTARLERSFSSEGISPVRKFEERSRVWRLVHLAREGDMVPRSEREERDSRKMRPLLHVAPWRWESNPLQGFAKLGPVQFFRRWAGSSKEAKSWVRHASSFGSDLDGTTWRKRRRENNKNKFTTEMRRRWWWWRRCFFMELKPG